MKAISDVYFNRFFVKKAFGRPQWNKMINAFQRASRRGRIEVSNGQRQVNYSSELKPYPLDLTRLGVPESLQLIEIIDIYLGLVVLPNSYNTRST